MNTFIISVRPKGPLSSDISKIFEEQRTINWMHRSRITYAVGDILYMYISRPIQKIKFKVIVRCTNLTTAESDLTNPTWNSQDGIEKQKQNDRNDRLELIQEIPLNEDNFLSFKNLKHLGLKGNLQGPTNITGNEELKSYIELAFNKH